ncbi:nucleic acid/nucleotide deaminase domain-containing protein [Paenibacillus sp. MMS18-CY102]|uniref:nucleic acid/nucleotide deaminase domain-containing protein n=1 Tax=Paenibacillus sp. MMS18-CY102 TaxID=2682849 RepID=UPI0013651E14|nr:nucleic acid/nucleotide deaminase domain-containing protein [Paenibacillus sp. MMS18-CY102]MWC30011.1 late control protein [Paenibacillus sp. MMS18-CY102]
MKQAMEAATYRHLQIEWAFGGIRLEELELTHGIGEHARMRVVGKISEQQEQDIVKHADSETVIELHLLDNKGQRQQTLFMGALNETAIHVRHGVRTLVADAISHTFAMDTVRKDRSFQHAGGKLMDIADSIIGAYPGGDMIDMAFDEQEAGQFIMQYEETDWVFLRRLASFAGADLVPDVTAHKPRLCIGLPEGRRQIELPEDALCTTRRNAKQYWQRQANGWKDAEETDGITYTFERSDVLQLGDEVKRGGQLFVVMERRGKLKHGLFKWTYACGRPEGLRRERVYNRAIIGASIEGKVMAVSRDQVKLHLDMDDVQGVEEARWFPYSAEGNQVWYMMPEKGTPVKLYFPSADEDEAMVIQSVRQAPRGEHAAKQEAKMSDPGVKSFSNPQGKGFTLGDKELEMTAKEGQLYISLNEYLGVRLNSALGVSIHAAGNLRLEGATVHLEGMEGLSITAGSDTIELVEDVNVHSEQIVLQADKGNRKQFEPIQTAFEQELARIGPEAMKRQRIDASNKATAQGYLDRGVETLKGIWGFTVDAADATFTGMVGGDEKARDIYSTLSGKDVGSLTERNATVQGAIQTGEDAWAYGGDIVSGDKSIGDAAREASQWAYDEYLEPFVKQQENRRKLNPLTSSAEEYYEAGRNDFAADMVGVDIALTVVTEGAGGAVFKGIKKGTELAPDVPGERKIHGKGTEEEGTHSGKDKDSEDGSARPHPDEQDAPAVETPTKDGKLKTNAMPRKNPLDELEQIAKRIRQMMEVLRKEPLFVQNEIGLAGGFGVSSGYSLNPKIAEIWKAEGHGGGSWGGKGTGKPDKVPVPKIPKQVVYGETDLSAMARKYRIDNQIYDLRNLVVAEIEIDGVRYLKVFESTRRQVVKPSGKVKDKNVHSEMALYEDKLAAEKNGQTYEVKRVYTEREPCIIEGHDCKKLLSEEFPDAEVTYSVEYGDKASRDRGNEELAKEIEKVKE